MWIEEGEQEIMSKKIMKHCDKEDIIRKLNDGESVRAVEGWLKEKYPTNKNMWVTSVTLQTFRKDKLNLEGKVLKDIQEAKEVENRKITETMHQRQLEATNAYQDKINEIAETQLDVHTQIAQLNAVVESRIAYWYNMIASGEELPAKADTELRKYIDQQVSILQQYKKLVEGMADKTIDYNVNITVFNDQIHLIRKAIRDTIAELGTEQAMIFMDNLNKRLGETSYRPSDKSTDQFNLKKLQDIEYELLTDGESNE